MIRLRCEKWMASLRRFAGYMTSNREYAAVTAGLMAVMGLVLAGTAFRLMADIPILFDLLPKSGAYYAFFIAPAQLIFSSLSVFAAAAVAFHYARALNLRPVSNALSAAVLFTFVAAPNLLVDGPAPALGVDGLFLAVITALLSLQLARLFLVFRLAVRLPRGVPPALGNAFLSALPLFLNLLLWNGAAVLVNTLSGMTIAEGVSALLAAPLAGANSVPAVLLAGVFCCFLSALGIPGLSIFYLALLPAIHQAVASNAAAVTAGESPVFYAPLLFSALLCAGGLGNPLGLILHGLRSKSDHIRAVSRAAVVPAIFQMGEPALFGYPVFYNLTLLIPHLLTPLITMLLAWLGYAVGFFQPIYTLYLAPLPLGTAEFLGAMAWQNLFLPVLGVIVGLLVSYPFLRLYEGQLAEGEAATRATH